ncbi:WhiB family transcriptional regulator [Propionicimonas sp.]|uniref:WhiB family transcriptional regulator n=1 Tax=Propionicimonas sp. TaxID=1955623 RepID=UPI0017B6F50D|nr:WhiB family transcriptional regulator [Propionicimonas sp.]MBU4207982.1 WhiB family transcriptional regulator [Actinomycetota bacterium]MBU4411480.1 WhiB family transcriptional regulator [Actinomycetota bacterium]
MISYAVDTKNTLGATGAPSSESVAPAASSRQIWDPACVGTDPDSWVPADEAARVPEPMAEVCRSCDGRLQCLLQAMHTGSEKRPTEGYWAGTTTRQRVRLGAEGDAGAILKTVDTEASSPELMAHPVGEGSATHYRYRACRCSECRQAHTLARREERARARARHEVRTRIADLVQARREAAGVIVERSGASAGLGSSRVTDGVTAGRDTRVVGRPRRPGVRPSTARPPASPFRKRVRPKSLGIAVAGFGGVAGSAGGRSGGFDWVPEGLRGAVEGSARRQAGAEVPRAGGGAVTGAGLGAVGAGRFGVVQPAVAGCDRSASPSDSWRGG